MAQHTDRLPQCDEKFERIEENHAFLRKSVDKKLDTIQADVKTITKALFDGNGEKGLIYKQDDRISALEVLHEERQNAPPEPARTGSPRTLKEALLAVPWFGWPIIILSLSTLHPYTWDALTKIFTRITGG